jgi:hypothetical protein
MPSFTQLTADTFQRANEVPLNPAVWPSAQGYLPAADELEILNNECTTTILHSNDGKSSNAAIDWTAITDQWCEVELKEMANGSVDLYLRAGTPGLLQPCYDFYFAAAGFGTPGALLVQHIAADGATVTHIWVETGVTPGAPTPVFNQGDKLRVGIVGDATSGQLFVYQNGILLFQGALSDDAANVTLSGHPGMQLVAFTPASGDIGVINFAAGSMSLSSPPPFLGSVRVVGSAPAGAKDNFLGTVHVVGSAPAGNTNPYLGQIKEVLVAPAGDTNPSLGDVVVVGSAPAGDSDPYLGSVISG